MTRPPVLSTTAFKSVRATGAATLMAGRGLNSNATTTANATAKTAMMRRARRFRLVMVTKGSTTEDTDKNRVHGKDLDAVISVYPPCSQWWSIFLGFRALEIRERQFDVAFSIVLIVLEREGDVERRFVLGEVVVALRGAPGDRAEDAPFLLERHLEVPLLQLARAVDNLDPAGDEHWPRIACAERRKRGDAGGDAAGDAAKRQIAVDAQPRHQILGAQRFVGHDIDRPAQVLDPRRVQDEAGRLFVAPEPDEEIRTALERREQIEMRNAPARPVSDLTVDRQNDGRSMKRVDQFRGDDADDASVPSVTGNDQHRPRPDVRVGLNNFSGGGENLRLL